MRHALIIFVRDAVLGKVKTRLAASLGNEVALSIYKKLLQHTLEITQAVQADKFVFYADAVIEQDMWKQQHYYKSQQHNGELGERMLKAFEQVFNKGYSKVCIIGSDCCELSSQIITDALDKLNDNTIVIGPAKDGGYYLLGIKKLYPHLFQNKNWSTSTVFADTIKTIEDLNLRYSILPTLSDVDEAADVPERLLTSN
jgi:uncharacterized protein